VEKVGVAWKQPKDEKVQICSNGLVPIVVGDLWEQAWIETLFSLVSPAIIPKPPWQHKFSNFVELNEALMRHSYQNACFMFVTNLLNDPDVLSVIQQTARNHTSQVSLVTVDEDSFLDDRDCADFLFVVRVGFAHYPRAGNNRSSLWFQPPNALVVPLGLPSAFPKGFDNFHPTGGRHSISAADRPIQYRAFSAAFAGRIQNLNRAKMLQGLRDTLPGRHFVHITGGRSSGWAEGLAYRMAPWKVAAALADAALAPSPPGNR
jgi:hypothetical protein